MTVVSSHALRAGMETAMEATAENLLQQRLAYNPDAEVNSLGERIFDLDRYGVPPEVVRALIADVGALLESIDRELGHERQLAGSLDEWARLAHNAECNGRVAESLTIKTLTRALRPHLRVIADHGPESAGGIRARREVERLVAEQPQAKLRGKSLRNELGKGPHELLLALVDGTVQVVA